MRTDQTGYFGKTSQAQSAKVYSIHMNLQHSFLADILGKIAWAVARVKGVSSLCCLGNWYPLDDRKVHATLAQKRP